MSAVDIGHFGYRITIAIFMGFESLLRDIRKGKRF